MLQSQEQLIVVSHYVLNQSVVIQVWEHACGAFPFAIDLLIVGADNVLFYVRKSYKQCFS